MKIGTMGAELYIDGQTDGRMDRQTDMTKFVIVFRNFARKRQKKLHYFIGCRNYNYNYTYLKNFIKPKLNFLIKIAISIQYILSIQYFSIHSVKFISDSLLPPEANLFCNSSIAYSHVIDISVNCNWVDTQWQQYSTHPHTNST